MFLIVRIKDNQFLKDKIFLIIWNNKVQALELQPHILDDFANDYIRCILLNDSKCKNCIITEAVIAELLENSELFFLAYLNKNVYLLKGWIGMLIIERCWISVVMSSVCLDLIGTEVVIVVCTRVIWTLFIRWEFVIYKLLFIRILICIVWLIT